MWTIEGNTAVLQEVHTPMPTVFYNDTPSQGMALTGQVSVTTDVDDDFFGFVLGYNSGDNGGSNDPVDYLMIDWKKGTQTSNGDTAEAGLAISRVTGTPTDVGDFWGHSDLVQELARGTNLGDVGWVENEVYNFDIQFTSHRVVVRINGLTEIDIKGDFSDGSFGFYNLMQAGVRYSGVDMDVASIPVPAPLALLGLGLVGIGLSRKGRS